jgi:hypothetical protein
VEVSWNAVVEAETQGPSTPARDDRAGVIRDDRVR